MVAVIVKETQELIFYYSPPHLYFYRLLTEERVVIFLAHSIIDEKGAEKFIGFITDNASNIQAAGRLVDEAVVRMRGVLCCAVKNTQKRLSY